MKVVRGKRQVTYNGKHIRIRPDFSTEVLKARRSWIHAIQNLREQDCQPRLLYPANLAINIDGETKVSQEKNKFKQYLSTNSALQRVIEGKVQYKEVNYMHNKKKQEFNSFIRTPKEKKYTNTTSKNKNITKQKSLVPKSSQHQ